MKVLLIDDDLFHILGHMTPFEGTGIEIITAQNLTGAEQAYTMYREDLGAIVMDGCVPGNTLNTLPLIGKIAADIKSGTYTGILMAASSSSFFRNQMVAAGCTHEAPKEKAAEVVRDLLMATS